MNQQAAGAKDAGAVSRRGFLKAAGAMGAGPLILGASDKAGARRPVIGAGAHRYEVIHDWGELPAGMKYGNTHGVCQDSAGRIYVHHTVHSTSESHDTMVVFDESGKFVKSWGKEFRGGAHGLHIQKEAGGEFLYLCDTQRALVVKTTLSGEEVYTLGYPKESAAYPLTKDGKPAVKYSPTNVAVAPNGDLYVADGYGSNYINQYNSKGEYIRTFGGTGSEPGKLACPHGLVVDLRGEPTLVVADRTNQRLQYFTLDGKHLKFSYGVKLPCHFHERAGVVVMPDLAARVTLLDGDNAVIAHLGEGGSNWGELRKQAREAFVPGQFICPHGACFDREGNIFVVEWVEIGRVTKLRKVG